MTNPRQARVERATKESKVLVDLKLDGTGVISVETGVPFFDHMISQLGKHSGFDLTVKTEGDVDVDSHHTVEDTSLAFGQALREALGDKSGIRRLVIHLYRLMRCWFKPQSISPAVLIWFIVNRRLLN